MPWDGKRVSQETAIAKIYFKPYNIAYLTWQLKEAVEILPSCFKQLKGTINTCQSKHYKL